ncbi:MAG: mechanosensitive ion channel family protein [Thaumarchaeota archaeon]|nr:mechanosensitive ion channel family protein [Nitrososphaerota archaeon]
MAYLSAANLPPTLGPQELALLVELAVLAITIRTAGAVARQVLTHVTGKEGFEREIVYGIYGLGVVAVAYALLTFPGSPKVVGSVWEAVGFIAGVTITYLVAYVISAATRRYGEVLYQREPHLRTTVVFVRRLIVAVVVLVGVGATTFAIFPSAGAAVASIFIAAGFASIVVGLAAQSSLANIFAGMIVSTAQPFRIGDAVLFQMPWGAEWCWVEDIRLTFTVLKTWDKRRLVVPNQIFLNQSMVNYDLNDSSKLCVVYVTISYESDVDKAIEIMKQAARQHPDFLPDGNLPVVHLMDLGDANGTSPNADVAPGITLRLLSNAKDQPTNFQMSKDLLYAVRKEFQKNGIMIAYPRREVLLREERRAVKRPGGIEGEQK